MNKGLCLTLSVLALSVLTGCNSGFGGGCGSCAHNNAGLFSNVQGTRILAPQTGAIVYPQTQVANLPGAYYNTGQPQPTPANNQGWRPINVTPSVPTTNVIRSQPTIQSIPTNNLVVASGTSTLNPSRTLAANSAQFTTPATTPPAVANAPINGGLQLNDATNLVAAQTNQQQNNGIVNRAWEYVANPVVQFPQAQQQFVAQPFYVNPANNNTVVATSSTSQGFSGPRPSSYVYSNGYQPNANTNVANGWRQQRDVTR